MKKIKASIYILMATSLVSACEMLETKEDILLTEENVASNYSSVKGFGYMAYSRVRTGFYDIDNNLFAAASDEAEQTASSSQAQLFNTASWNAFNNPDNVYSNCYEGIRAANYFLEEFGDYKALLAINRDTLSDNARQYHLDVQDVAWMRNENRVLRAYFYFELLKRYGGVPLVTKTLSATDNTDLPRAGFEEIVNFIVSEIDAVKDNLQTNWKGFDQSRDGRLTKGAALAIKARTLLYAASPLHNAANDLVKWQKAAIAARDIIALNQFSLFNNYQNLFITDNTVTSPETIWAIRLGPSNDLEKRNYPVGTPGGNTGITPSHNLVASYEYKGSPNPANPYANRDPRLSHSVATNNAVWNGRTIEIWNGGRDAATNPNASRTGYYLKKFLNDNLNLVQNETKLRSWIIFRYGEILLNYAEAMNEAYGPDDDNGFGMSARQAVNLIRNRPGVLMPPVIASGPGEMRIKIKHERRVELAFENHRYWDLLRWKDAEQVLNMPLKGVKALKTANNEFAYTEFTVETRRFISPQMYYYPIPQTEVSKSHGILTQNPEW
jgi:hypothetical protein